MYVRGITKSPMLHKDDARDDASNTAMEDEPSRESPSPTEESRAESEPPSGECTTSTIKQEKPAPTDEPPYFQEQW